MRPSALTSKILFSTGAASNAATNAGKSSCQPKSSSLMLAGGQILGVLRKLAPSHDDIRVIWDLLRQAVHPVDFVVLSLLGWGTVPLFRILYYYTCLSTAKRTIATVEGSSCGKDSPENNNTIGTKPSTRTISSPTSFHLPDFERSYMFHISNHVSQAARLAILVYFVDCWTVVLTGLGFSFSHLGHLSLGFAKILYIVWAAQRLSVFKRYLLGRAFVKTQPQQSSSRHSASSSTLLGGGSGSGSGNSTTGATTTTVVVKLGQAAIIDRLVDGIIYIVTGLFLLDILDVEMGVGVSSIFAFGSAGTLVMGLASKDVASMFVSGLTLTTTDHVREGDHVKFGDGTTGQIVRIGWMHTTIRGYDELVEVVPNSVLGMQRVKNISRLNMCQVKENLRLRYEDAERIPLCCADILREIVQSCPDVITDGTRPLRAVWRGYEKDHLVVMVDVHFRNIKPIGTKYWNNRQAVLLAIQRAVKKNGCEFVTTFWPAPMGSDYPPELSTVQTALHQSYYV